MRLFSKVGSTFRASCIDHIKAMTVAPMVYKTAQVPFLSLEDSVGSCSFCRGHWHLG